MNDFKKGTKFSFGKVELAVIPNEIEIDENAKFESKPQNPFTVALENKQRAVDALNNMRYTLPRNTIDNAYAIIRDSLEEMAELIRKDLYKKNQPDKNQKKFADYNKKKFNKKGN